MQWSDPTPTDTLGAVPALFDVDRSPLPTPFAAPNGIVLMMGCRNAIKANKAQTKLQNILDHLGRLPDDAPTPAEIPSSWYLPAEQDFFKDEKVDVQQAAEASLRRRKQRSAQVMASQGSGSNEQEQAGSYRRRFCTNTVIEIQPLDLGSMASVLTCARNITDKHGYVTHVILNAGLAAWEGLDWFKAAWMLAIGFRSAVTYPKFKKQRAGDVGADGYGWVWQCNVAAHYVLVRALLPALRATPFHEPSRIVWTGSVEAYEHYYHPEDYQCLDPIKSGPTYESTKFQCELVGLGLEAKLRSERVRTVPGTPQQEFPPTRSGTEPRSFVSHPGIVASAMFGDYLGWFLSLGYALALYMARWLFSPHHVVTGYKAGIAASFLSLAPAPELDATVRYSAQCNFWGQEYVGKGRIDGWERDATEKQVGKKIASAAREAVGPGLVGGVETEARDDESPQAGERIFELAADLVAKLEAISSEIWKKAGQGKLPPFDTNSSDGEEWERL